VSLVEDFACAATTLDSIREPHPFFDRVVVINLKRRPDRLDTFWKRFSRVDWPFRMPEVVEAVDGEKVPCPHNFEQGGGAFGCRQSHIRVLEHAMMDDIGNLLVLEDDAFLNADSVPRLVDFLQQVPEDWEQLMLGGQHIGASKPVRPGIVKALNCQRTHAYAIRGKFLQDLYVLWLNTRVHIDWKMGEVQSGRNVYAPDPFIFGQEAGRSDISGAENPRRLWSQVAKTEDLVVLLHAPKSVMGELRMTAGWWGGGWRDSITDVDMGLREIFEGDGHADPVTALSEWITTVSGEVEADGILVVYHKDATMEVLKRATDRKIIQIRAETAREALRQFEALR
jgi:GR25 family glycosyltransferase involved in LPS biosynthesis